jgi:hypothetical protein
MIRFLRPAFGSTLATLCVLAAAAPARAAPPLLPAGAFQAPAHCAPIDPFAETTVDDRERTLQCGAGTPLRMAVRTPRLRSTDAGPGAVEVELDKQVGWRSPAFTALARLGVWAGSPTPELRLQTRRTLLAASGLLRLTDDLALDLGIGRDASTAARSRATATALFRPLGQHLVYVQVAAQAQRPLVPAVGLRWWILPGSASLDLAARRLEQGDIEPRIGLRWSAR